MFLVRAQNSHGLSLPSPVTSAIRTQGGSLLVFSNVDVNGGVTVTTEITENDATTLSRMDFS